MPIAANWLHGQGKFESRIYADSWITQIFDLHWFSFLSAVIQEDPILQAAK
jgi:hypothetical protein